MSKSFKYSLILILILITLFVTVFFVNCFVQYSSFPIGIVKALIGCCILYLIDDVIFKDIDTIQAIKDKNISYAIVYLSNALIIALCLSIA